MVNTVTREDHLNWCKARALAYVDVGDLVNAWAGMCSDLQKHEETVNHPAIMLGMSLYMTGQLNTAAAMKSFIQGFN